MRLHGIRRLAGAEFMQHPRLSAFHRLLFHGDATRGGQALHVAPRVWYSNGCRIPLDIVRAGNCVPEIFQAGNWVISEAVKQRIDHLRGMDFLPVNFAKLIEFPLHPPGDFSWYSPDDKWRRRDPAVLLERLPDVPEYHDTIGRYYELLAPRLCDIRDGYGDLREADFVGLRDLGSPRPEPFTCDVSVELLRDYPIVLNGATVLRADVFDLMREFIDWEYFLHDEAEV